MQLIINIIGLLALLFIAWLLSYHRKDVRFRVVTWGLALQLVFAVIILRSDAWSFVGMAVLGLLLIIYILQRGNQGERWQVIAAGGGGCIAVSLLLFWLAPAAIGPLLLLCLVLLIAGAVLANRLGDRAAQLAVARRFTATLLIALGVAWLVSHQVYGSTVFKEMSDKVAGFLNLSDYGAKFLFGNLADGQYFFVGPDAGWPGFGMQFAFKVLPTIIFFGGFMGVLYHLGVMHRIIDAVAGFMRWTIGTSGAETFSCSANIFVGQTEGPLLIKPFLDTMTRSELLTVMVGGFATIAGGVLAGYIAIGIPAGHLIAASVMSAPAALVIAKIIFPEKEHSVTAGDTALPEAQPQGNVIEAASNGISDGLHLAINVGAMLIGFIALIAVIDVMLSWLDSLIDGSLLVWIDGHSGGAVTSWLQSRSDGVWSAGSKATYLATGMSPVTGEFVGIFPGSLQTFFGTILRPLAWLMGVAWADADKVGNLLGIKLSLNEFVAYGTLSSYINSGAISERAQIISTYALCGFANFSSIGIQIGGISAVAPSRKADLAKLGLKAMFGGALASWLTATIAGILL